MVVAYGKLSKNYTLWIATLVTRSNGGMHGGIANRMSI